MYHGLRIAVIIPAFREETRIAATIASVPAWVDVIVAVDDCSPDETFAVMQRSPEPRLTAIRLSENQGVGGATMAGFKKAAELRADVLVKMDADGQMDPALLPALLEPIRLGRADYVKGNRFLHTRALLQMPLLRRVGNIGLSFLTKLASGYWPIFDPSNGFIALHAAVFSQLDAEKIGKRFFFETSLLIELSLHRAVVRDMYMPARYGDKVSSLSERQVLFDFPPKLLRGFVRRITFQYFLRDFSAVSIFLLMGSTLTALGVSWGGWQWLRSLLVGVPATTGTVMLAVLPLILGIQMLLQALVLDIHNVPTEPIHRDAKPPPAP